MRVCSGVAGAEVDLIYGGCPSACGARVQKGGLALGGGGGDSKLQRWTASAARCSLLLSRCCRVVDYTL